MGSMLPLRQRCRSSTSAKFANGEQHRSHRAQRCPCTRSDEVDSLDNLARWSHRTALDKRQSMYRGNVRSGLNVVGLDSSQHRDLPQNLPNMGPHIALDPIMNTAAATRVVQEQDTVDDLDPECFETFDDVKEELREVEEKLAKRFKIRRHVRRTLFAFDRANMLEEDDVVARWHELYSRYLAWVRFNTLDEQPCELEEAPCVSESIETGAADAAPAAFVGTDCSNLWPLMSNRCDISSAFSRD